MKMWIDEIERGGSIELSEHHFDSRRVLKATLRDADDCIIECWFDDAAKRIAQAVLSEY